MNDQISELEDRLREAYGAAAETIAPDGIRALREPVTVIAPGRGWRRANRGRVLVPLAAAAAIVAIVAGVPALRSGVLPGPPSVSGTSAVGETAVAHTGFVGYQWTVTAISHGGPKTPIPAYFDSLEFYGNGQFLANEPVNSASGSYRVTSQGFTTGVVAVSLVGVGYTTPVEELAIGAMDAFAGHLQTRATVDVTGDRMVVYENGYTLFCTRAAKAIWVAPQPTG